MIYVALQRTGVVSVSAAHAPNLQNKSLQHIQHFDCTGVHPPHHTQTQGQLILHCYRSFLFDSNRLLLLLGPFIPAELETCPATAITMDDVSMMGSVVHARLALLQAGCSLFASLPRDKAAREQLQRPDISNKLINNAVKVRQRHLW